MSKHSIVSYVNRSVFPRLKETSVHKVQCPVCSKLMAVSQLTPHLPNCKPCDYAYAKELYDRKCGKKSCNEKKVHELFLPRNYQLEKCAGNCEHEIIYDFEYNTFKHWKFAVTTNNVSCTLKSFKNLFTSQFKEHRIFAKKCECFLESKRTTSCNCYRRFIQNVCITPILGRTDKEVLKKMSGSVITFCFLIIEKESFLKKMMPPKEFKPFVNFREIKNVRFIWLLPEMAKLFYLERGVKSMIFIN